VRGVSVCGDAVNPSLGAPGAASMPRTAPQTLTPRTLERVVARLRWLARCAQRQPTADKKY